MLGKSSQHEEERRLFWLLIDIWVVDRAILFGSTDTLALILLGMLCVFHLQVMLVTVVPELVFCLTLYLSCLHAWVWRMLPRKDPICMPQ